MQHRPRGAGCNTGLGPKSLCTKNGPHQYFLLYNCVPSYNEIRVQGERGGLLPRLSALPIHPCRHPSPIAALGAVTVGYECH